MSYAHKVTHVVEARERLLSQFQPDDERVIKLRPLLLDLITDSLPFDSVSPFRIEPAYAEIPSSLFDSMTQEWWDFYHYGYNAIMETSTVAIAKTNGNIANGSHTIFMRFSVPSLFTFVQLIRSGTNRQTIIQCWGSLQGLYGPSISVHRVGTTGWSISAGGVVGPTYAFGQSAYVIMSSGPGSECRVRFSGGAVSANTGNGGVNAAKAIFDAYSGYPPGVGGGAFPNLTSVPFGAHGITNAWHYWGQAFTVSEINELADWIAAGNPIVV